MHGHGAAGLRARGGAAFTLIKLLVVIAIIAPLIGLLLPSLAKARAEARAVRSAAGARSVVQGIQSYIVDTKMVYPPSYVYADGPESMNWRMADQQRSNPAPANGYIHWSHMLFASGTVSEDAFASPVLQNKGAPRANPGPNAEDYEAGDPNNDFMPGQFLARNFILQAAPDRIHNLKAPTRMDANPTQVALVRDYTLANNALANPAYAAFNTSIAGKVPTRATGTVYSDGVANGASYINQNGDVVAYNGNLDMRNLIAGDFDGDGARGAGDVAEMLKAYRQRNGGPSWNAPAGATSGGQAIIEVLGDFDGNGSFNAADVRYFADGLFLVGGALDRKAGFTRVDTEWSALTGSGSFFGTTKSTGTAYAAGDARGDIAGAAGTTRGAAPVGADGVINAADIVYLKANIVAGQASGGDWSDLSTASAVDLSCDLTGDLRVDLDDLAELYGILGTCAVDYNLDGFIDFFDYDDFVAGFEAGSALADFNNDGFLDFFDYDDFVNAFESGC